MVTAGSIGAAPGITRVEAMMHSVVGLAVMAFTLYVATLHPQLKQQGGDRAATEADAVTMRTHGLLLLLSAGAHASAALVAAFVPDASRRLLLTCKLHLVGLFAALTAVAVGSFPGQVDVHMSEFIAHDVVFSVPLCVFFLVFLAGFVGGVVYSPIDSIDDPIHAMRLSTLV